METYDAAPPSGIVLDDAESEINRKINNVLAAARLKTGSKGPAMVSEVFARLGDPPYDKPHMAPIEIWANSLSQATAATSGLIYQPQVDDSQYRGTTSGFGTRMLAPVLKVGDTIFGVDKLGHFFQLGYNEYYKRTLGAGGLSADNAATEGDKSEVGMFGLHWTGVYSRADIAANRAGLRFYQNLATTPGLPFSIRSFVTDDWNEQKNPNLYTPALTREMEQANLPGNWQGLMTWTDGSTPMSVTFPAQFKLSGARSWDHLKRGIQEFSATYQYRHPLAGFTSGTLEGTLANAENSDGAVTSSDIDFVWTEGKASGRGALKVENYKQMSGKWGRGASADNGGTWRFTKLV